MYFAVTTPLYILTFLYGNNYIRAVLCIYVSLLFISDGMLRLNCDKHCAYSASSYDILLVHVCPYFV